VEHEPLQDEAGTPAGFHEVERIGQQAVQIGGGLTLLHAHGHGLDGSGRQDYSVQVFAKEVVGSYHGKFVHLVQGAIGALEVHQVALREQLQAASKACANATGPFGHGSHLAGHPGIEENNPIRLGQVMAPDDDGFGGVQRHGLPKIETRTPP
jgi:hypothetical protein